MSKIVHTNVNAPTPCLPPFSLPIPAADPVVGINIFMYGNCASNQQIEPWHGTLGNQGIRRLIGFLKT